MPSRKNTLKLVVLTLWLLLIGGYLSYSRINGFTHAKTLATLVDLLASPYGPLLYIVIFALHPLIFSSAAVLGVIGGAIFGVGSTTHLIWAVVYALIGSQSAAQVAYWIGRFGGSGFWQEENSAGFVQKYAARLRQHSFATVFLMRLLFLPFDLVDYAAGILQINWPAFTLATLLGSFPGTVAFVTFGASLDLQQWVLGDQPTFNPKVFGFSLVIFVISLVIARFIRQRATRRAEKMALP